MTQVDLGLTGLTRLIRSLALMTVIKNLGCHTRPGSGRTEKTQFFRAEKILPMIVPYDASDLSFWAGLGPGPSLGGLSAYFVVQTS
jgi:hypothetical protein